MLHGRCLFPCYLVLTTAAFAIDYSTRCWTINRSSCVSLPGWYYYLSFSFSFLPPFAVIEPRHSYIVNSPYFSKVPLQHFHVLKVRSEENLQVFGNWAIIPNEIPISNSERFNWYLISRRSPKCWKIQHWK